MRSRSSSTALTVWLGVAILVQAAEPASSKPQAAKRWPSIACGTTAAVERIRAALDNETQLDFIETPLDQVVAFIADQHDLPVRFDKQALQSLGIAPDTRISHEIHGISLRSGLSAILRDLDLDFAIVNEVLLITVPEVAARQTEVRIYNVADLIGDDADSLALSAMLQQALNVNAPNMIADGASGGFFSVPEPGLGAQFGGGGEGGFAGPGAAAPALGQNSWRSPVHIIPFQKLLVVRATGQRHLELAELLAGLAEAMQIAKP